MDVDQKKDLTISSIPVIQPTNDEIRMLENLRIQASKWPHGRFGPVFFITHEGVLKYGTFRETEHIETRI